MPLRPRRLIKLIWGRADTDLIFVLVTEAESMAAARPPQPAFCVWRSRPTRGGRGEGGLGGWGGEEGGGLLSPPRAAARANEPPCASGGGEEKWVRLRGERRKAGSATASDAEANRRETGKGYTHTKANLAYIQV